MYTVAPIRQLQSCSMRLDFLHFHQGVLSTIGERLLRMLPSLPTPLHYLTTAVQRPIVPYLTALYIYIFSPLLALTPEREVRSQVSSERARFWVHHAMTPILHLQASIARERCARERVRNSGRKVKEPFKC